LAATGAGIANASVTAKCATGTPLTGTTDANGSYNLVLDGRTLPCMVQVTGGTPSVTLHSFAQAAGRVNITPVTDLIVAKALGSDPATAFTGYVAANGTTIETGLAAAKTYVSTQINAITGGTIADPLTGAFSVGDADDKVLDALGNAMSAAGKTIAHLRTAAQSGDTLTGTVPAYLAAPAGLTATASGSSTINLSWTAVPGATGYKVFRGSSAGVSTTGAALATTSDNAYGDTGLSASATYYYKVVATNTPLPNGGAASEEKSATTGAASTGGNGGSGSVGSAAFTVSSATPSSGSGTLQVTSVTVEDAGGTQTGVTNRVSVVGTVNGVFARVKLYYTVATGSVWNVSYAWGGNADLPDNTTFLSCEVSCSGASISGTTLTLTNLQLAGGGSEVATLNGTVTSSAITVGARGGSAASTWTPRALPGNTGSFADVVWDGNKFVAIGTYVGTSTDGATWTSNAVIEGKGIAKSGSTLLLAGISTSTGSDIRKSVDGGTNWTRPATANIFTVTGNSSMFVGVGGGAEVGNGQAMLVRTSADGETWTTRYTEAVPNAQSKVTSLKPIWSGSKWLISAVKYDPNQVDFYAKYEFFVLTSTDGIGWTKTVVTNVKGNYIWPWWPVWNGTGFALIDKGKTLSSTDGLNWSTATNTFSASTYDFIGWTGSEYVAFSGGGSAVKVWTSSDANTWTSTSTSATQPIYGATSNGSTYVAVGNQYVFTSP
jgi:hypothetical protein